MIADLLKVGHQKLVERGNAEEATKKGTLRGGTIGCVTSSGIIGKCHRIAMLRMMGVQAGHESGTDIMFAAGRTNEDSWMEVLKESWDGVIKRESEIPVSWATDAGIAVTGRPDIVLCDKEGKPVRGLELKLVSSVWTMIGVLLESKPKTDHLIQAAHYMWQIGVPFELWYTSRVHWPIVGWMVKFFKGVGFMKDSVFGEELTERGDRGDVKKVLPFYNGFELDIRDGVLYYRIAGGAGPWVQTLITIEGIKQYYELVGGMAANKDLMDRPLRVTAQNEPMSYNPCDAKYCPFAEVCNKHERDYDDWVAAAHEVTK